MDEEGESMECQKVRDRFSSYLEKELTPPEEKEIRDHLRSCPECQKEFEKFEKTMQWLHSVGEVELPDAFVSELYQKMEERKKRTSVERSTRWLGIPLPFKLSVQAMAMIAVVFLVLYLVKMIPKPPSSLPVEKTPSLSLPSETSASRSTQRPSDSAHGPELSGQAQGSPEGAPARQAHRQENSRGIGKRVEGLAEREQAATEATPGAPRLKHSGGDKSPTPKEEKFEVTGPQIKTEGKMAEGAAPKTETMTLHQIEPKKAEGPRAASRGSDPSGGKSVSKEKSVSAPKPPQEIVLRISDREKAVSQIRELVAQFNGEMITKEGDAFLASLPASSFSDFEKRLTALNASEERFVEKSDTRDQMAEPRVKKDAVERKGWQSLTLTTEEEDRIVVRILLVQE